MAPTIADVRAAAARIAPFVRRTPVVHSAQVNALCDAKAMLKCEHLQHTGAFKYRDTTNAVQSLTDAQAARGVRRIRRAITVRHSRWRLASAGCAATS